MLHFSPSAGASPSIQCAPVAAARPAVSATPAGFAAIDFGTSNSAIALPQGARGVRLVELEPGFPTMPTAVFYRADGTLAHAEPERLYGRAAIAAYVEGLDGRLMRSMKSILGSRLVDQSTDVGGGRAVRYVDVIAGYLRHLKRHAEAAAGAPLERVVLGRPVFFVDGEPERDALAQKALEGAARDVGFADVRFQYEPIAAALDHESSVDREQLVLVADIGGGTSDFSLVRVGPQRRGRADRRDDILANHGVHVAGTDFDRHLELAAILPLLGYRSRGPARPREIAREVPSGVYFDLATWHLINTAYAPARVAELRRMRDWYADASQHARLLKVLEQRLGHALAAAAEQAKIEVATAGAARIELGFVEPGLAATLSEATAAAAIESDLARVVAAAQETLRQAGIAAERVQVLYFTGGSTGLAPLVDRIAAGFPRAERVRGDRFASVAQGLGLYARAAFGA
jgi:hypothetical chaperone protein